MVTLPRVIVYTDGGARGNPGPAAIGIVVCDGSDRVVRERKEFIAQTTNNEAEYRALVAGLELAADFAPEEVACVSDSELLVRQMAGTYRIREPRLSELASQARERARRFRKVTFQHRPRLTGHLRRADELVNEALDEASWRAGGASSP